MEAPLDMKKLPIRRKNGPEEGDPFDAYIDDHGEGDHGCSPSKLRAQLLRVNSGDKQRPRGGGNSAWIDGKARLSPARLQDRFEGDVTTRNAAIVDHARPSFPTFEGSANDDDFPDDASQRSRGPSQDEFEEEKMDGPLIRRHSQQPGSPIGFVPNSPASSDPPKDGSAAGSSQQLNAREQARTGYKPEDVESSEAVYSGDVQEGELPPHGNGWGKWLVGISHRVKAEHVLTVGVTALAVFMFLRSRNRS
eukprot:GHVU01054081.1.p2 GENE.GHVU01054081.1~~GHVU01054081.1.p2  ORF type:complete len:250 (+),score=31.85 GHVU01054081.1:1281-2030(+)